MYFIIAEEKEGGRKKRRTAKHAEEIIRKSKKYLNSDSDSSDSEEEFVTLNHNVNKNLHPASPPSLKRNCPDNDDPVSNGIFKKLKMSAKSEKNDVSKLSFIEKFFQRDIKDKLTKLKQEVRGHIYTMMRHIFEQFALYMYVPTIS